jgi:hypothetical protein
MPVMLKRGDLFPLGFTDALIRSLLGEPDEREPYKRGIYNTTRFWFAQERVQKAMESPAFLEAQRRRQSRAAAPLARLAGYSKHYQNWRAAAPDACHALHSANRYAKHGTCSEANKAEIYALKNAFVQLLYESGFCSACWEHVLVLPPKKCRACGGSGNYYDERGGCDRCGGSGDYLPEKRLKFYVFKFAVGRGYTWHQPAALVTFPIQPTALPAEWSGVERDRPLGMPRSQLAAAKDLIRWVLAKAKEPEKTFTFSEVPIPPIVDARQEELFA